MNQENIAVALFLKGLLIAVVAATGLLGVLVAFAFGVTIVKGIGSLTGKIGSKLKRKPKEVKPVRPVPPPVAKPTALVGS
jgi:hypothetical protein